jgi:hypothetical protein
MAIDERSETKFLTANQMLVVANAVTSIMQLPMGVRHQAVTNSTWTDNTTLLTVELGKCDVLSFKGTPIRLEKKGKIQFTVGNRVIHTKLGTDYLEVHDI